MNTGIVVIGSTNIDLVMKMERLPRLYETVGDATFIQSFGGKGANQAVGAARATGVGGVPVNFVGCVGDDSYSALTLNNLQKAGVRTDFVFQETGVASGTALIMIGGNGENYITVAPGANYRLGQAHLARVHDLVAQADMIVLQYEIRPETLLVAIDLAVEYGKPVMFNLALAHPIDLSFLVKIIFLVVYEVEAEFLAGFPVESEEPARRAAVALQQLGPATVIITLVVQGALISTRTEQALIPAFKVTPVDSTAAGDIFCGSLAVALVESQSVMDSVRFASAAAAISVTRLGAQPSAPSREEIDRFLAQAV